MKGIVRECESFIDKIGRRTIREVRLRGEGRKGFGGRKCCCSYVGNIPYGFLYDVRPALR